MRYKGMFGTRCFNCKKEGHWKYECPYLWYVFCDSVMVFSGLSVHNVMIFTRLLFESLIFCCMIFVIVLWCFVFERQRFDVFARRLSFVVFA